MSFIPRLEELESREMLDANVVASDAAVFLRDAVRFGNDMGKSVTVCVTPYEGYTFAEIASFSAANGA